MNQKTTWGLIIFSFVFAGIYLAERFFFSRQTILYPNFGIEIPSDYSTHGIDVSRYQKNIDWELVAKMTDKGQKISFAIIKATEGNNMTDPFFKKNWKEIDDFPLMRGAYLYFHPNKSGKSQAEYFISKVNLKSGDFPPVIDVEESNGMNNATIQKAVKECADLLESKYHKKPIIYTSVDFYSKRLGTVFQDYPLWAAHYERLDAPRIKRDWLIWQHNCKGHVNGIDAEVDFNVVNGSLFALSNICIE